tara:strand:- start:5642 stop:6151 length:510 start_codon:yes stop_codon:yes gene_type:complete
MKNQYVKEIKGNLLDFPEGINILCHCANAFTTFGGGIALSIKERYPEAYNADCKTTSGDKEKMGTISYARIKGSKKENPQFIANIYGQYETSSEKRAVDYEAIARGIERVYLGAKGKKVSKDSDLEYTVGFPRLMGSALAKGDWPIIRQMIWTYALKYKVKTVIVDYNG